REERAHNFACPGVATMPKAQFRRLGFVWGVAATFLAVGAAAVLRTNLRPPAPKVDGATEKELQELVTRAARLLVSGKFAEAANPARAAARLASGTYGPKDWRAFDAGRRLKLAETGKDLPAEQRKRLVDAIQAETQAEGLEGSEPAEAEKRALHAAQG